MAKTQSSNQARAVMRIWLLGVVLLARKHSRAACLLVLAECGRKAVLADLGHLCLRHPGLLGQASAGRERPGICPSLAFPGSPIRTIS